MTLKTSNFFRFYCYNLQKTVVIVIQKWKCIYKYLTEEETWNLSVKAKQSHNHI